MIICSPRPLWTAVKAGNVYMQTLPHRGRGYEGSINT
jgi:hypothetical protein